MQRWITGKNQLSGPFVIDSPNQNVIVTGDLISNFEITFKVKNLILLGKVSTPMGVVIEVQENCFSAGILACKTLNVQAPPLGYRTRLDDVALNKIQALGVDIKRSSSGAITVNPPAYISLLN